MNIENAINNYFAEQEKVLCVYLFGSTAAGKENKFSDVDIAVLFDVPMPKEQYTQESLAMMDDLSRILNNDVDVVVLNSASCFLKFQIIKNGLRVYERQGRDEHEFETKTMMEYFDFLPVRKRLETALIDNISGEE